MLISIHLHLHLMSLQCLVHDGCFDGIVILYNTIVLVRLHVGAIVKMLDSLIRVFIEGILDTVLASYVADLVVRPTQLTRLPRPLASLVIHEALQVRLQLIVHFNSSSLDFVRSNEREVRLSVVACIAASIGPLLIGANVEICFVHLTHLLQLSIFLPFSILFLEHCQLFEELLFLCLTHLALVRIIGHFVSNLLQMILHQLVVGHLFVIIDFLSKFDHLVHLILPLEKFVITDITRAFEYHVAILRIRIRYVENAAGAIRVHGLCI